MYRKLWSILICCCVVIDSFARGGGHGGGGHAGGRARGARAGEHRSARRAHPYKRGYGRGGARHSRNWNHHNWGGWGWHGWFGSPWAWSWGAGLIAGISYAYTIPQQAVQVVYNGNYRYWGDGLGVGTELDSLAREGKWDQVKTDLEDLRQKYYEQLEEEKARTDVNEEKIKELQDRLNKVQLHINGMQARPADIHQER